MGTMEEIGKTLEARLDAWKSQIESMEAKAQAEKEESEARTAKAEADKAFWDTINSLKEKVGEAQKKLDSLREASDEELDKAKANVADFFDEVAEAFEPEGKKPTRH
jgi:DNA repair exonuclease SbcCD ATPase subunit